MPCEWGHLRNRPAARATVPDGDPSLGSGRYGLVILLAGALTMAGSAGFARYSFPLLLPDMRESLHATYGPMGLLATMNNVGYLISALLGGVISARFGPRRVMFLSMLLGGVFTIGTGLSPGVETALVLQFLVGLSLGAAVLSAMGLVASWFDPRQRGVATGVVVAGFPLGLVASSFFLPLLLARLGPEAWRYGWMVLGALVVLLALVDLAAVRERPQSIDPGGGTEGQQAGRGTPLRWGLVYKNRSIWHMAVINFFSGLAIAIFSTFFVAFLVAQRGLTVAEAAQAWGLVGLTGIASGVIWGRFSDIAGRRFGLAACNYVFFVALAVLAFVPLPGAHYLVAVLSGLTFTGGVAVIVAFLGDSLGPRLAATAFGLVSFLFNVGQVISPSLAGGITDATGSFTFSLVAATVFAFVAAALCHFMREKSVEIGALHG